VWLNHSSGRAGGDAWALVKSLSRHGAYRLRCTKMQREWTPIWSLTVHYLCRKSNDHRTITKSAVNAFASLIYIITSSIYMPSFSSPVQISKELP
jgi:hypothetical protein